ncbi:trehalose-phosphatase [Amaricoccus solimangrovi]|uniref:Trehalose 6-phosphate phosphatase n=1 Tax=Amaricoccus solimangrovi TaxID=2589815 RepID=A0A501WTU6_9RHOB|nr:trehalose-phosphatase [Amaricoccus solimangrovi]TPE49256.1 trehalose-phosphatase [Amaricoccus solimangrovi]
MSRNLSDLRLAPGDALFLDFDGTLAELRDDPDAVRLDAGTEAALARLAARLSGALALLSGRDIRDLDRRTPRALWRAGGHGLEVSEPGSPPPPTPRGPVAEMLERLDAAVAGFPGARIEVKGPILAIHYRAAPEAGESLIAAAKAEAERNADHVAQAGHMVVEVKPASANKGRALRALAARAPFAGRRPVMIGDDTTDEDAIAAALDLGGVGVRVGPGESAAGYRAADPAEVRAWIAREAARLG